MQELMNAAACPFLQQSKAMTQFQIFVGIDSQTKVAVVDADGEVLGQRVHQQRRRPDQMADWIFAHNPEGKAAPMRSRTARMRTLFRSAAPAVRRSSETAPGRFAMNA